MPDKIRVRITVNGTAHDVLVEPRTLLADLLRDDLALAGTHAGLRAGRLRRVHGDRRRRPRPAPA